jgi:hypothetical protein
MSSSSDTDSSSSARDMTDEELDAYGTGVSGDTSATQYREREKQAQAFVRAIEKVADESE